MPLPSRAIKYLPCFEASGTKWKLDPYVLASLCERETACGTSPLLDKPGPSGRGDGGHAYGLMCIDDRWHGDWLKTHAWWEPSINIDKGAEIFASSNRMLGGYLPAMIAAYNCGPRKASRLLLGLNSQTSEEEKIVKLDAITTRNYVSGVLHILEAFKK